MHPIFVHDDYKTQIKEELLSNQVKDKHLRKWMDKL